MRKVLFYSILLILGLVAAQAAQASATTDQHAPPRFTRAEFPIESSP
jgi:hypothetical protein